MRLCRCSLQDPPLYGVDTLDLLSSLLPDPIHGCKARNSNLITVMDCDADVSSAPPPPAAEGGVKAEEDTPMADAAAAAAPSGIKAEGTDEGAEAAASCSSAAGERWLPRASAGRSGRPVAAAYHPLHLTSLAREAGSSYQERAEAASELFRVFMFYIPKVKRSERCQPIGGGQSDGLGQAALFLVGV